MTFYAPDYIDVPVAEQPEPVREYFARLRARPSAQRAAPPMKDGPALTSVLEIIRRTRVCAACEHRRVGDRGCCSGFTCALAPDQTTYHKWVHGDNVAACPAGNWILADPP